MRAFLVSDNLDSLVGLRLAGIEGLVARAPEEIERAIQSAIEDPEVGILVLRKKSRKPCRISSSRSGNGGNCPSSSKFRIATGCTGRPIS